MTTKHKFCINCGNQLSGHERFCNKCGFDVSKINHLNTDADEQSKQDKTIPEKTEQEHNEIVNDSMGKAQNKSHKFIILFVILVGVFGLYKNATKLPDGSTDTDSILIYNAKTMDPFIFMYGSGHSSDPLANDYKVIYLYKNTRTKRYVFPVKDLKTHKTHFCYLESIGDHPNERDTVFATDIYNKKWGRVIDPKVAKIKGNNPHRWEERMSINYYSENISNLADYYDKRFGND